MARGCEAAGYRLAGEDLDRLCARHLYGSDRLITAWLTEDHAVVVTIGPHDRSAGDVYELLLLALDAELPTEERSKPPCCDDDGKPPADPQAAESIADAVDTIARARRRR